MAYRCRHCGRPELKWLGRCPTCGRWDTFVEVTDEAEEEAGPPPAEPQPITSIALEGGGRRPTGLAEFDRVLGGGVIAGSLVLIGGEPGIGKSTLLLQVAGALAREDEAEGPVLYVSGEEAAAQVKLRAERLGLGDLHHLWVLSEQRLSAVKAAVRRDRVSAVIVDSIQSVLPAGGKEGLGSAWQVGQVTFELNRLAKAQEVPLFLVGHVTKGGEMAGPKAIEHMVDVVLYLEGGREGEVRLLRAVKNRYGSTAELGVFQMKSQGLIEIPNPSKFFTARQGPLPPGTVIVPTLEGTRPILVELQALVADSPQGYPQRRATGLDVNRLALLLAVIEKRLGIQVGRDDVYVNVAGGLTVRETACDLGTCLAVISSFKGRAVPSDTVVVGEVGLSGEVRRVAKLPERLREAAQLGYKRAVVPAGQGEGEGERALKVRMEIRPAADLAEAAEALSL